MLPPSRLDIYSVDFDPREALLCPQLQVPYPEVAPLNNLAECRRLLPAGTPDALKTTALRTAAAPSTNAPQPQQAVSGGAVAAARDSRQSSETRDRFSQGPLKLLRELMHKRVCVVTRHRTCVRGTCTGVLIAADRHLNLLLIDAEDAYIPDHRAAPRSPSESAESDEQQAASSVAVMRAARLRSPSEPGLQPLRRRFGQLLLRGEGIVLVYAAR